MMLKCKRRDASLVTVAAKNAELSEWTIGCRRMQKRVHFSKASRSAKSSLPTGSWRTLFKYCHPHTERSHREFYISPMSDQFVRTD